MKKNAVSTSVSADNGVGAKSAQMTDPTRDQVQTIVPVLSFEDDPLTFANLLRKLAHRHALADEQ